MDSLKIFKDNNQSRFPDLQPTLLSGHDVSNALQWFVLHIRDVLYWLIQYMLVKCLSCLSTMWDMDSKNKQWWIIQTKIS